MAYTSSLEEPSAEWGRPRGGRAKVFLTPASAVQAVAMDPLGARVRAAEGNCRKNVLTPPDRGRIH
jgi:hypothetical protein